jgi:site-specific DNA-methyltransferase (adenine-specific)
MTLSDKPRIDLIHGDCMIYMATLPDNAFELAIVDPPYWEKNQPFKEMRANGFSNLLNNKPNEAYFAELKRVSKGQIVWGANNFNTEPYKGFVVWDKLITGVEGKYSSAEIASISDGLGTTSKIFKYSAQSSSGCKIHPTQKPVALYRWLLHNYAKQGDRILDTHLGSGSSAIACHGMGFDMVGIELDADYYTASVKRFKEQTSQLGIFT